MVSDPKLADAVFTDPSATLFSTNWTTSIRRRTSEQSGRFFDDLWSPHASSFSRGKGTLFLVDAKSKQVVWSIFEKPKDNSPATLNKTAKKVIEKLELDNGMKPVKQ